MKCGECTHYEPERSQTTGRPLPSQPGYCTFPVEWPKVFPKSFSRFNGWTMRFEITLPTPGKMLATDTRSCATFIPKPKGKQEKLI